MIDPEGAVTEAGILQAGDDVVSVGCFDIDEGVLREDADAAEDAIWKFALAVDHACDIARLDALCLSLIHI